MISQRLSGGRWRRTPCRLRLGWLVVWAIWLGGCAPELSAPPRPGPSAARPGVWLPVAPRQLTGVRTWGNDLPAAAQPALQPTPTLKATPATALCATAGQIVQGVYPSQIEGPWRNYRIYLPPCYTPARTYPTLYLLHGNVRADEEWDEIGIDESAESLIHAGRIPPLLIVMPDGRTLSDITSGGPGSYEDSLLSELIPFIEQTYCAAPQRAYRALGGLSRGGYWALEIAFRHPDQFISVGGHEAALLDIATWPEVDPEVTVLTHDLSGLRIYLDFAGGYSMRYTAQGLHETMLSADIPHVWLVHPDGQHEEAYWMAHAAEYLLWYAEAWPDGVTGNAPCHLAAEK